MGTIVLVGHGTLPIALKQSVSMILGELDEIKTVCLEPEEGGEGLKRQLDIVESELPDGERVVVLADLLGGSPCNTALERFADRTDADVIAGMNLPMVISAVIEGKTGAELVSEGRAAVCDVKSALNGAGTVAAAGQPGALPNDPGNPHVIAGVRVDSRGIHGQVATAWIPASNATRVILVDDAIIKNDIQKMALKMAKPEHVKLSILSSSVAAERLSDSGSYPGERLFVVIPDVMTLGLLDRAGFRFETVNMGNVPNRPGTTMFANTVRLTEEETDTVRALIRKGTHFTVCQVPKDPIEDFDKLVMR